MAVKINKSTAGDAGPIKRLFQGIMAVNVVAVNPSLAELGKMGFKTTDRDGNPRPEPAYMGDSYGLRIEFWVEGKVGEDKILNKIVYFLKDKLRTDLMINKQGNFGKDASKLGNDLRNPLDGEIELLMFIQRLCDVRKGEELYLETIQKMAKTGNVKELKEIVSAAKENVIKVMMGIRAVRDEKSGSTQYYQEVYARKVEAVYGQDMQYLHRDLQNNGKYLNADYGVNLNLFNPADFILREFSPTPQPEVASSFQAPVTAAAATGYAAPAAPPIGAGVPAWVNGGDDDLPF